MINAIGEEQSDQPEKLGHYFRGSLFCGLTAFECGGAGAPNRLLGEGCLSAASS